MKGFETIKEYIVSPEDNKTLDEIRAISDELAERAIDFLDTLAVGEKIPEGLSYGQEFTNFLKKKMEKDEIYLDLETLAAYHYAKGSSPPPEKITSFDTEDDFIFNAYKKFSETFLK